MRSPGKVVTREEISENVLGRKFHPFDRSLDMHVSRLRRKLSGKDAAEESGEDDSRNRLSARCQLHAASDKGLKGCAASFSRYSSSSGLRRA